MVRQARHWGWGLRVLGEDQMAPCCVPIWASGTKAHAHVKKAVGVGPGEEEKARGSPSCVRLGSSGRPPPRCSSLIPSPGGGISCRVYTALPITCSCDAGLGQHHALLVCTFSAGWW